MQIADTFFEPGNDCLAGRLGRQFRPLELLGKFWDLQWAKERPPHPTLWTSHCKEVKWKQSLHTNLVCFHFTFDYSIATQTSSSTLHGAVTKCKLQTLLLNRGMVVLPSPFVSRVLANSHSVKIHDRGTLFYSQLGRSIQLIIDHSNSFSNVGCSVFLEFKPLCPNQKKYLVLAWEIRMPRVRPDCIAWRLTHSIFTVIVILQDLKVYMATQCDTHQTQFLRLLQSPKG